MLTAAPLPRWSDLATLPGKAASDETLAAPWRRSGDEALWFSRGAWALRALADGWRLANDTKPAIWLPDYFCNQSARPLRDAGYEPVFYPVQRDLTPRWKDCQALAGIQPPDIFVLVHYFGRTNPATIETAGFCRQFNALLVEDAAHVLRPVTGIGEHGAAVLYSPHKLLALPDGAILTLREALAPVVARAAANLAEARPSPRGWLLRRTLQKTPLGGPLASATRKLPAFTADPLDLSLPETPVLSDAARKLLPGEIARLDAIAETRRHHAKTLSKAVGNRAEVLTHPNEYAPYRLVMQMEDERRAAKIFDQLQKRGTLVETWPDVAPEVKRDPDRHRDALLLRRTLLFLPVHQSLDLKNLLNRLRR
ncbi:hypothetical protein [Magnetospira sp. QH-2]|uniref:hypothetical protein n=1 Tax=Magnetospira sp. (strain QH-2) TaxID=1288970 RepID=UPI0003E811A9|nr:hypothetical protein [Magnetospira sp. QH-2]CCQ72220.1 Putative Pyridoxal phosphate-dependent transferase (major domain) [Magnetospira sp. QH-2]